MKQYYFKDISVCEMCGDSTKNHKVLGQRLNKKQGFRAKRVTGISVSVVKCTNCELIYSNPQPIPYDLQDHYGTPPEDYWKEEYFVLKSDYFSEQVDMAKLLLKRDTHIKALDIGAGLGKAMIAMQNNGFDVYGLEPSAPFYERAISKMGISVERLKLGAVEAIDYEEASFDFISFGAVFEHLYEPSKCLEKAFRWLKPDGIIHIEVPSSNWLISRLANFFYRLSGTNYVTNLSPMHAPFHLYEFGLQSFYKLAPTLHYEVEKHYFDVCSIYHFPKVFHPLLYKYMKATHTGMQLTVYLRKK